MLAPIASGPDSIDGDNGRCYCRTYYSQSVFDNSYLRCDPNKPVTFRQKSAALIRRGYGRLRLSYCGPTTNEGLGKFLQRFLYRFFPFLTAFTNYDVKASLVNDLITGFTIGVMHVPQGMAYAMLATLPPVYGLYCSMCASFFYFFFGTSRHLSLGTLAIISLLVGAYLDRNTSHSEPLSLVNRTTNGSAYIISVSADGADLAGNRVLLASALAMVVGIMQLMMGILRLGFLTRLLSHPMLTGFTVGSSVHVGISQIFVIFGLDLKKHTGLFNVPLNFYKFCANLKNSNWVTFGLSLSSIGALYLFQLWINPSLRKRIKVPVPIELLTIILGGVVSHYLKLRISYNVRVVGAVPAGFPEPIIPRLTVDGEDIGDAFVIALIGFSLSYSLAAFYSHKEGYKVDPNQELIAYGITNISGSFFTTYPVGASISRTALVTTMGGKSQIVGLVASVFVLLVVLFAGPLFYDVPNCCLSAIILVALRSMFAQLLELPILWRYSVWDFASWVVSFTATVFLDVLYGLIIGIAFSVLVIFVRTQLPKTFVLGRFDDTEVFKPRDLYTSCVEDPKVRILRYEGSLFYSSADLFVASVIDASGFDPRPVVFSKKKLDAALKEVDLVLNSKSPEIDLDRRDSEEMQFPPAEEEHLGGGNCGRSETETTLDRGGHCHCPCFRGTGKISMSHSQALVKKQVTLNQLSDLLSSVPLAHIILDCSAWSFIDLVGAKTLQALISDYNEVGVQVYLSSPSRTIYTSLIRSGLFEKFDPSIVFISVYDAYISTQRLNHRDCDMV